MGTTPQPIKGEQFIRGEIYHVEYMNNEGRRVEEVVARYRGDWYWRSSSGSGLLIKPKDIIKAVNVESFSDYPTE